MSRPHYLADMIMCVVPERDGPVRELPRRVVEEEPLPDDNEDRIGARQRGLIVGVSTRDFGAERRALIVQAIARGACTANDVALMLATRGEQMADHTLNRHLKHLTTTGVLRRTTLTSLRDIERAGGRYLYEVAR